jgi:RimJ/RimL family protein N-acetyltransferase
MRHNALGQAVGEPLPDWKAPLVPSRMLLNGRYCRLEPLSAERHGADLWNALGLDASGGSWSYLPYGPFASFEEYTEWLAGWERTSDPLFFAVIDAAAEKAVGVCAYLRIDAMVGCIEVGHLYFSPLLQRTPAATEAMYLMMMHAFELGYRRYEWKCDALNEASRRAAQRFGFSFEGVFRQARVIKGRNRDTAWFSVIDGEWPALRAAFERWLAPENFDPAGRQKLSLSALTLPLLSRQDEA